MADLDNVNGAGRRLTITPEVLRGLRAMACALTAPQAEHPDVRMACAWLRSVDSASRLQVDLGVDTTVTPSLLVRALDELRTRRAEATQRTAELVEALDIFDLSWCPEHGHAPRPEVFERITKLRSCLTPPKKTATAIEKTPVVQLPTAPKTGGAIVGGMDPCACGDSPEEHGRDPNYPCSTCCNVPGCECVAYEADPGSDEADPGSDEADPGTHEADPGAPKTDPETYEADPGSSNEDPSVHTVNPGIGEEDSGTHEEPEY